MKDLKLVFINSITKGLFFLGCFVLVQSCSGTNLGKKLADSFENPIESNKGPNLEQSDQPKKSDLGMKKSQKVEERVKRSVPYQKNNPSTLRDGQFKLSNKKGIKFTPQAYRIIIKLPGVNPSAPAEKMTRALRDAGVIFEIERIERVDSKSSMMGSSTR